jgi:HK97 family phage major capsid protein
MANEIITAIEGINSAFDEFRKTNDERLEAESAGNKARAAELGEKLDRIDNEITELTKKKREQERLMEAQKERIEILEALNDKPRATVEEKVKGEYSETFMTALRSGFQDREAIQKMRELQKKAKEMKATTVSIGTTTDGGYAVPEEISRNIEALMLKQSDIINEVDFMTVGTSDFKKLVSIHGTNSAWVAEDGTRSATNIANLREVTPTWGELYSYCAAYEWALQDIFFDVQAWLERDSAEGMAKNVDLAVWSGNGTNKPTGLTNSAPTAVADYNSPLRAKAVFEYVPADDASPVTGLAADDVIDLVYKLNRAYRPNAKFGCNTATQGQLRRLKSSQGEYYWQPSFQSGQPDRLMGYPVFTFEDMGNVGTANALSIGFGDWRKAYCLTARQGLAITVDNNITSPGTVKFYIRRRWGGIPVNNDALKFLKHAAS